MSTGVEETSPTLRDRMQSIRRHKSAMLIAFVVTLVVSVALAIGLPPTYRAKSTILLEQQEIPQELVRSSITTFADQRVQIISQRVMTAPNLMAIIERYHLYPSDAGKPRETLVEKMRDAIALKMISANVMDPRSGHPVQANIAFTLSYDNRSAALSERVANELTSLYLNENLSLLTKNAAQTTSFLTSEEQRINQEIERLAAKLSEYKRKHVDTLPELSQANFQGYERTQLDVRETRSRLLALDQQRILLEAQLAQLSPTSQIYTETGQRIMSPADRLKTLRADLASLKARYGPDHPDIARTEREIAGLETAVAADGPGNDLRRQLDDAKGQLAAARERYTEDHPDVQRLERTVDSLQKQLDANVTPERSKAVRDNADNPVYVQVRGQLDSLRFEAASLSRLEAEQRAKLEDYERRMSQAPEVEKEYRELVGEYASAQLKLQEVTAKRMEAQLSQNLDTEGKGQRFTLIEPPSMPEKPVSPNRPLLLLMGLVLSLLAAFVTLIVRDSADRSVRSVADLTRIVDVTPLAAIPHVETKAEVARRSRAVKLWWSGTLATMVLTALLLHLLLAPLDVLWASLLQRLGI